MALVALVVGRRALRALRLIAVGADTRGFRTKQLIYEQFGEPLEVVKYREVDVPPLAGEEVLVRMLAAPVNPADINTIQGKYPILPCLPTIPGDEGVGEVVEIGKYVTLLEPGHRVILIRNGLGTWRYYGIYHQNHLRAIPTILPLVEASMLTAAPCTAYRLIKDFQCMDPGTTIIQNAANSATGQNVIQFCKAWGINTVNIVRNRCGIEDLKDYLKKLGGTYVFTEEEASQTRVYKCSDLPRPILALNCVGGRSADTMVDHMAEKGVMVTYGGITREPLKIEPSSFLHKKISFYGFLLYDWTSSATHIDRDIMLTDVIQHVVTGKLKAPLYKTIEFRNFQQALINTIRSEGFSNGKYVFDFLT